jgi:hypothetical protein
MPRQNSPYRVSVKLLEGIPCQIKAFGDACAIEMPDRIYLIGNLPGQLLETLHTGHVIICPTQLDKIDSLVAEFSKADSGHHRRKAVAFQTAYLDAAYRRDIPNTSIGSGEIPENSKTSLMLAHGALKEVRLEDLDNLTPEAL